MKRSVIQPAGVCLAISDFLIMNEVVTFLT